MAHTDSAAQPMSHKLSILFVCVGNICRSVALEATLRKKALEKNIPLHVDSCGIGWWFLGEDPDPRTVQAGKNRGISIKHKAKEFQVSFFDEFDLILGVTIDVVEYLRKMTENPEHKKKVQLATNFSSKFQGKEIVDPYYTDDGFEEVFVMAEDVSEGLLRIAT